MAFRAGLACVVGIIIAMRCCLLGVEAWCTSLPVSHHGEGALVVLWAVEARLSIGSLNTVLTKVTRIDILQNFWLSRWLWARRGTRVPGHLFVVAVLLIVF